MAVPMLEAWSRRLSRPLRLRHGVVWTRVVFASAPAYCRTWYFTLILINLVQACYRDMRSGWPGNLDHRYGSTFPASWLHGFVPLPL
jgi:hypothetical protein